MDAFEPSTDEMNVDELCKHLEGWANQLASRFGHPVYLVGSALRLGDEARDVDVVIVLPQEEFFGRYGYRYDSMLPHWPPESLRYAADMGKLASYAAKHLKINVDLKVEPDFLLAVQHHNKPRVRIDKVLELEEVPMFSVEGCSCEECVRISGGSSSFSGPVRSSKP
jgi:predicted nucleotidyltransferase